MNARSQTRSHYRFAAFLLAAALGLFVSGHVSAQTAGVLGPQACSSTGFAGYLNEQITCQIYAPGTLSLNQAVLVAPYAPAGVGPVQCTGVSTDTYATEGAIGALSPVAPSIVAGYPGCEFAVTYGSVPAGAAIGTEVAGFSSLPASGALQQASLICSDPSCGTLDAFALQSSANLPVPVPVYAPAPPAPPYLPVPVPVPAYQPAPPAPLYLPAPIAVPCPATGCVTAPAPAPATGVPCPAFPGQDCTQPTG